MNAKEKELFSAINSTERMSGFDSYDSMDGESYFDGDDMSFADGDDMSYASGSGNVPVSDPYVIQFANALTSNVTAYMFGYNSFWGSTNYGNNASVTITNLQGSTYGALLAQSNNKPFKIGKLRFQSSTSSQLTQTVSIFHVDANGKQYSTPLNLSIMKDAYQFQSDILDINKIITIDGNTYLAFTLIASASLVISVFPVQIVSAKAELNGGKALNNAKAPRLSGKNAAPVIIQTTQAVSGVAK